MNPAEYALEVDRTRRRVDAQLSDDVYLTGHLLGLIGESGEVCDLVKKHVLHGHALDHEKLIKELGDVLWYNFALRLDMGGECAAAPTLWPGAILITRWEREDLVEVAFGISDHANRARKLITAGVFLNRGAIERALRAQLYEIADLASVCRVDLEHVARENIAKLRARFPEGFTSAASQARVDLTQHTIVPFGVAEGEVVALCAHGVPMFKPCPFCPRIK